MVTGPGDSTFTDVARMLAVRLNRRFVDVGQAARRNALFGLASFKSSPSQFDRLHEEIIKDARHRRNLVLCLDAQSLAQVKLIGRELSGFFVVELNAQAQGQVEVDPSSDIPISHETIDPDLQLNWHGFKVKHLARIIAHCLYG